MPVFWWVCLDLVFLVDRSASGGVFWGVCDLIVILLYVNYTSGKLIFKTCIDLYVFCF